VRTIRPDDELVLIAQEMTSYEVLQEHLPEILRMLSEARKTGKGDSES
jgi:hypothetical protein